MVAVTIPDPPQELREENLFFNEKSSAVEPEQVPAQPAEAPGKAEAADAPMKAEAAEASAKIATQVIAASALQEPLPGESGPILTAGAEAPGQATVEEPVSSAVAQQPAAQAAAVPPVHATAAPANNKLTLLPEWLRHLPETLASIPEAISDPPPATAPTSEPKPTAQPKPAANPAPIPKPTAKPQPTVEQKVDDSWCEPETLIGSLNELAGGPAGTWAAAVLRQLAALKPAIAAGSAEATAILDRLDILAKQTSPLSAKLSDWAFARKWRELGYALARRVDLWRQIVWLGKPETSNSVAPTLDPQKLADCLADAEAATHGSAEGKGWQAFLLLDDLSRQCVKQSPRDERLSRELAGQALARMTQIPLTPEQQRFISSPSLTALRLELWRWAGRPVGVAELLRDVERYERTHLPGDARRLAVDCQNLSVSPAEARRRLAERVDAHYRNANLRFSIAEEFLNKLIPEQKLEYSQVNERVIGRPVQGDSLMETKIAVRMLPDPQHARLALEVTGEIASITDTDAGPAQFHSESEARYVAKKPMQIDMEGISLWPVEIDVQNETRLKGVSTSVDPVPLISWLARRLAEGQYEMNRSAATDEMKQKIVARATDRINTEVRQRFSEVVDRLNQRVFDPLNSLALAPELIDAQTTEKQFTMRLRLGGEDQLGSHTPRPPALSNSLASLQIHESVINNGIQRLRLDGRTFTLTELSRHIAASLNCPALWPINSENDDVRIAFAKQNSVVVRCQDGQVSLTLSIARLCKGTRYIWNNFQVRAIYQPLVHGRSAQLVRENVIQLIGKRNIGSQMILRGVFAHALSRKTPWELMAQKIINQPKLQDAAVTQFVIEDGWIGISLGPKQTTTAHRTRLGTR